MGRGPDYDVSPDGRRFLFIKAPELDIRSLSVVLNWDVEVKAAIAADSAMSDGLHRSAAALLLCVAIFSARRRSPRA